MQPLANAAFRDPDRTGTDQQSSFLDFDLYPAHQKVLCEVQRFSDRRIRLTIAKVPMIDAVRKHHGGGLDNHYQPRARIRPMWERDVDQSPRLPADRSGDLSRIELGDCQ